MINNKYQFHYSLLIFITLVAICLRTYSLSSVPPRLTIDEMSIGYNAYSILKTGTDEWGKKLPLTFRAFGDYKLPFYIYSTVPMVLSFGLNPIAIRLISALSGSVLILIIYFISKKITHNPSISLLAAFILATNPWPIQISRIGLESNLGLLFFSLGFLTLIHYQSNQKRFFAIFAGIFFGLTFYTYVAFRLIVILFLSLVLLHSHYYHYSLKHLRLLFFTVFVLILPLLPGFFGSGAARFSQISIFKDIGYISEINEDRSFCLISGGRKLAKLCPLWINKPLSWSNGFLKNYLASLSPDFLFIIGDQLKYLNVPGYGGFFFIFLPFYLIGLVYVFRQRHFQKYATLFIGWLVSPIPSALAGPPQSVRASAMIPFVIIFISLGLYQFFASIKHLKTKKIITIFATFGFSLFLVQFLNNYFFIYPAQFDDAAYPLPPKLGTYLASVANQYDHIFFTPIGPGLHSFIAYYTKMDPSIFQTEVIWPEPDKIGFTHPTKLGKYEIISTSIKDLICSGKTNSLYITTNNFEYRASQSFYNFSGVNLQAQVFDLNEIKAKIICD